MCLSVRGGAGEGGRGKGDEKRAAIVKYLYQFVLDLEPRWFCRRPVGQCYFNRTTASGGDPWNQDGFHSKITNGSPPTDRGNSMCIEIFSGED